MDWPPSEHLYFFVLLQYYYPDKAFLLSTGKPGIPFITGQNQYSFKNY